MRLTNHQINVITNAFQNTFEETDHLWLFGSRTDDQKKGGDIDLYVETNEDNMDHVIDKKLQFVTEIVMALGEQKIDIVVNQLPYQQDLLIYRKAKETGILLI